MSAPSPSSVGDRPRPTTVLIVDDEALVRAGLSALLGSADDLRVAGAAGNGAEAIQLCRRHRPDVVLMDLRMPLMDGIEATGLIVAEFPGTRVLVVTTFDDDDEIVAALDAGASGYVVKDTPPEQLIEAVRVVASGESLLSPRVTSRIIAMVARRPHPVAAQADRLAPLTAREREVLVQVATGASNAEIAGQLVISLPTVKTHVSNLLSKLQARDRAQLVRIAYEHGLPRPPEPRG